MKAPQNAGRITKRASELHPQAAAGKEFKR
jgi:hypothetical protein